MRHLRIVVAGLLTLLIAQRIHAADAEFESFLARFRQAAVQGDVAALAGMTRTPFLYENRPLDAAGFARIVPQLFTQPVRHCLRRAPARREGQRDDPRRVVFCAPYAFYFGRSDGHYRLLEFAADGEDMP